MFSKILFDIKLFKNYIKNKFLIYRIKRKSSKNCILKKICSREIFLKNSFVLISENLGLENIIQKCFREIFKDISFIENFLKNLI